MPAVLYRRSPDVVWRHGPDRVLVRRVRAVGPLAHADLLGVAAFVWVALDRASTVVEVTRAIRDAEIDVDDGVVSRTCADLADAGWIAAMDAP